MTDLIRPSLYNAYHEIVPVKETTAKVTVDVVGPVASGDFLPKTAKWHKLKGRCAGGDERRRLRLCDVE